LDLWFNNGIVALDADRPEDYMHLAVRREGDVLRGSASAGCDILGPGRSIVYLPFCNDVLAGQQSAYLYAVLLIAGAFIYAGGKTHSMAEGAETAREAVTSGSAADMLDQ